MCENQEPVYLWEEAEFQLPLACHVRKMTITKIGLDYAEGKIIAVDYAEGGITFTEPWEAFPTEHGWAVRREPTEDAFLKDRNTGEAFFTMNDTINKSLKKFISTKLEAFIAHGKKGDRSTLKKYSGPLKKYKGPCVCNQLENSNKEKPFAWLKFTSYKFPERCFSCSCGKRWWCFHPPKKLWAPVIDPLAWKMLLKNNGVDFRRVVALEGQGGFKLLQTIRNEGFIPLG